MPYPNRFIDREVGIVTDAEVYNKFKNKVYGLALTLGLSEFDAKDVTSDVFEKYLIFVKSKNSFQNDIHMERWFVTVTKNAVMDFYRSKKVRYEHEMEDDISDIEAIPKDESKKSDFVHNLERRLSYEEVMNNLSPRYREVLVKYFDFGYSIKEIAYQMGESESNVKTLLFRAKKKYREIVERRGKKDD